MKVRSEALRNLPVVGTLLGLVAIAALGLAYWSNVTARARYLESRNFRLLADVAEQTQTSLYNSEQTLRQSFRVAADHQDVSGRPVDKATADTWAREVTRVLQPRRQVRRNTISNEGAQARRIAPIELWRGETTIVPSGTNVSDTIQRFKQYRSHVLGVGTDLRLEWTAPDKGMPTLSFQLPASALFAGAFDQARWDRAFSTMAVATPDGRILFAVGAQASEVRASSVAALMPAVAEKEGPNLTRFATAISEHRAQIAGVDYRMFTQPCCRADNLTTAVNANTPGLVVIGLADEESLRSLSLAISPVLVLAGAAFVMACLVGWAFIKCALMGVQQPLGRHDVINLMASGLFGVALATILLLTAAAYSRLSADVDDHLQQLARTVNANFTGEIDRAGEHLQTMVDTLRDGGCSGNGQTPWPVARAACQGVVDGWADTDKKPSDRPYVNYPDFITFSMIDDVGSQAVKAVSSAANKALVDVSARAYYQHARTGEQLWRLAPRLDSASKVVPLCTDGCYLEYLSSWNTGQSQVVLSTPTGIERLPVAAMSIPMHALLAPVLPPGFEFAVIDSAGLVQFHSDPVRNGLENLLLETDQNPRLRSLTAAHGAGTFNASYWGYPYRGYVRPARIPGWSIVVLHSKQTTRALVLEWFIVAMLLAGVYVFGWVIVMLLVLRRGASWLWPDPLRRHWYVPLGVLAIAATATWLLLAWQQPVAITAAAGVLIPLLTWAVVYIVLAVRPAGAGEVKQWTEVCRGYRFAGTVLFLLTAAVPAASFYALSYDSHIEAFVKERQIGLARRINDVIECKEVESTAQQVARYDDPSHSGRVMCVNVGSIHTEDHAIVSYLHDAFEDYLPYFTSASVSLRELMHHDSDDDSWFSERDDNRVQALQLQTEDAAWRLQVATTLPSVIGWRASGERGKIVPVAVASLLMLGAVIGAAYFVISFLLRRVLLADVVEPIQRRLRIVTQVGQHLQVICLDPSWMANHVNDLHLLRVAAAAAGPNAKTLAAILSEVSDAPASQRIAISDLEDSSDDAELLERKLQIVEAVMALPNQTLLLFTRRTAGQLEAWVRERCDSSPHCERWLELIGRLSVTELPARSGTTWRERWMRHLRNLEQGWREEFISRWQDWQAPLRWRARLLEREGQSDPKIDDIATELQKSPAFASGSLTRDQILEEIEESADPYYRELWQARSDDERVLLEHVARHGLASAASRRIVRRLLTTGLLRKDPELRLMSESFRRFVLESERRQEVAALERQAEPSLWDRLRVPLALSGTFALLFLLMTQREALDATVSMALGATTAAGTLAKLTNLLTKLSMGGGGGDPKANA